jgi:hypothetical protein
LVCLAHRVRRVPKTGEKNMNKYEIENLIDKYTDDFLNNYRDALRRLEDAEEYFNDVVFSFADYHKDRKNLMDFDDAEAALKALCAKTDLS